MQDLENSEILAKWLAGTLSDEEQKNLLENYDLNDLKVVLNDIATWEVAAGNKVADFGVLQNKINKRIEKKARVIQMRRWMLAAASIVAILGSYFLYEYFSSDMVRIETAANEQKSHVFPDGSKVEMDASTTVVYDQAEWENKRSIIFDGTALFEVTSGAPFMVNTPYGKIEVLGTIFNVRTGEKLLQVGCYEGEVLVTCQNHKVDLLAGETVSIYEGEMRTGTLSGSNPDWMMGVTTFKDARLIEVVEVLNNRYAKTITLPKQYREIKYSGQFVNDDFPKALKMIFDPVGINYTLESNGEVKFQ